MGKKIKIEHFQNLVAVAFADDKIEEKEKEFLAEQAFNYGLEKEDIDDVLRNAENLKFIVPANHEDKETQLTDAIYMAMVDGEVHPYEYDLCLQIARKLDFDEHYLNEIIGLVQKLNQ
ncbi:MAG: hypothetical protein U9N85_01475 [Bacteroidota bacterium]|nr:hypothetical protein [Bacteroidota bacterium]